MSDGAERTPHDVITSHLDNRRRGRITEDLEDNCAYAFLQWRAVARDMHVSNGADSFVVENGRIKMQTISYALSTKPSAANGPSGD